MAWSSPPAFVVSQIVTAAQMNILSGDLAYLKGQAGGVTIENTLTIAPATGVNILAVKNASAADYSQFQFVDHTASAKMFLGYIGASAGLGARNDTVEIGSVGVPLVFLPNNAEAARFTTAGNFGIGTTTPAARLHVAGVGGGMLYLSAVAVNNTLQTLAIAGTVQGGALFYVLDRNNTGGAIALASGNGLTLSQTFTIANNDTMTVALTAGGAITVQRTTGTNGTHNMNMLVLYY